MAKGVEMRELHVVYLHCPKAYLSALVHFLRCRCQLIVRTRKHLTTIRSLPFLRSILESLRCMISLWQE
jgi:hypothetical protein